MNTDTFFNGDEEFQNGNSNLLTELRVTPSKKEIRQGMSTNEVAEVISDHVIEIVKQQFEKVKRELDQKAQTRI